MAAGLSALRRRMSSRGSALGSSHGSREVREHPLCVNWAERFFFEFGGAFLQVFETI